MKLCAIIFSLLLCGISTPGFARGDSYYAASQQQLKTGIYELEGYNPGSNSINYRGKVEIQRNGNNYELNWYIGSAQRQYGIAIFANNVLSVSYVDASGNEVGVVSYVLLDGNTFEGRWASFGSGNYGIEVLRWSSY